MQVETSREAVERHAYNLRALHFHIEAGAMEALLSERDAATARAEAAERERDDLRAGVDEWYEKAVRYISERDAATAERDRMKAALEKAAIAAEVESAGHAIAIIEAALTSAKEAGDE